MSTDHLRGQTARILSDEIRRRRCSYVVIDRRLPREAWDGTLVPRYTRSLEQAISAQRKYRWRHRDQPTRCAVICERGEGRALVVVDPIDADQVGPG